MYRTLRFAVIVGSAWMLVKSLPGIARYFRMRSM